MEYKKLSPEHQTNQLNILKFKAVNGFIIVLNLASPEELAEKKKQIETAGHECQQLKGFNPQFDSADMFVDMRDIEFIESFDLEDWL